MIHSEDNQDNLNMSDDEVCDPDYQQPDNDASSSEILSDTDSVISTAKASSLGKKKVRLPDSWARNRMKKARNEGKEYVDRNNKIHHAKKIREYCHQCRYECKQISEEMRLELFKEYWGLGNWELQTAFLGQQIKTEKCHKQKQGGNYNKEVACVYTLHNKRVCKPFFLHTLDISNKRITNVVKQKKVSQTGVSPRDKRGKKEPTNKIPDSKIDLVKEHINSFPRYTSHYSRQQNPERKYLNTNLSIIKMYSLYKEWCVEKQILEPVKESFYRHIFNTKFNLSFHRPLTDTCATCDKLQVTIEHGEPDEKHQAEVMKEVHLRKAEAAKAAKDDAAKLDVPNHIAICFDLQKMMPTPLLSCSKAYYARQLWTYNFCIHNLKTGLASMFMWHEGQASRGCLDIVSCLFKFINDLPSHVTHITAFSDNAGGQNKSNLIVKFWLYIVKNTQIKTVDHRFLVSGHSFMECDQNFGVIEKEKHRSNREIFVPQHWCHLVAKCSRKFIVTVMEDNDFLTLDTIKPFFKDTVPGIRAMQWFHFKEEQPYTLFYKNNASDVGSFETLNMKSKRAGKNPSQFPELAINNIKPTIKYAKYRNLIDLLPYVPPVHHSFYINLPHTITVPNKQNINQNKTTIEGDELERIYQTDEED